MEREGLLQILHICFGAKESGLTRRDLTLYEWSLGTKSRVVMVDKGTTNCFLLMGLMASASGVPSDEYCFANLPEKISGKI